MTPAEFRIRCRVAESCLPNAEYRKKLTELHDEMLSIVERAVHSLSTDPVGCDCNQGQVCRICDPDIFTPPAPAQEPVCRLKADGSCDCRRADLTYACCKYTTPPAPAQPLTDEQIMEMYNEPRSDAEMIAFARAIEAAHGITKKGGAV